MGSDPFEVGGLAGAILREWRSLMLAEIDRELHIVETSGGIETLGDYKERVGRLYAYRKTLELAEEAADNVRKRV